MTDWREQIEAQIASIPSMILDLENAGMFAMAEQLRRVKRGYRKTLDVAVAAEQHITQGQSKGVTRNEWHSFRILSDALDKLREVGDE